jgi:hypothetical protein
MHPYVQILVILGGGMINGLAVKDLVPMLPQIPSYVPEPFN